LAVDEDVEPVQALFDGLKTQLQDDVCPSILAFE
jgi:hypothetical protein